MHQCKFPRHGKDRREKEKVTEKEVKRRMEVEGEGSTRGQDKKEMSKWTLMWKWTVADNEEGYIIMAALGSRCRHYIYGRCM